MYTLIALYSAMDRCLDILSSTGSSDLKDWMIVLTDGEDTGSDTHCTEEALKARLRNVDVSLVIIGIGSEVQTEVNEENRKIFKY